MIEICLFCHAPVNQKLGDNPEDRLIGRCPACDRVHHLVCWKEYRGCSTLGCVCNPNTGGSDFVFRELIDVHAIITVEEIKEVWREFTELLKGENDRALTGFWKKHQEALQMREIPDDTRERMDLAVERLSYLKELKAALDSDKDAQILEVVAAHPFLTDYYHAHRYQPRIRKAHERQEALGNLSAAVQSGDEKLTAQVWYGVHSLLADYPKAHDLCNQAIEMVRRWEICKAFLAVFEHGDPLKTALQYFRERETLEACRAFTKESRTQVGKVIRAVRDETAAILRRSMEIGDEDALAELHQSRGEFLTLAKMTNPQIEVRLQIALQRSKAIAEFRKAAEGSSETLLQAYEAFRAVLDNCLLFNWQDRQKVIAARRDLAYRELKRQISAKANELILRAANDARLAGCTVEDPEFSAVQLANRQLEGLRHLQSADSLEDEAAIYDAWRMYNLAEIEQIPARLKARAIEVEKRMANLSRLRRALRRTDIHEVFTLYQPEIWAGSKLLTTKEHERAVAMLEQKAAFDALLEAFNQDDDHILAVWNEKGNLLEGLLDSIQLRRIEKARCNVEIKHMAEQAKETKDPAAILGAYERSIEMGVSVDGIITRSMAMKARKYLVTQRQAVEMTAMDDDAIPTISKLIESEAPDLITEVVKDKSQSIRKRLGAEFRRYLTSNNTVETT